MIVYISIGNNDDKLSQADWHVYWASVDSLVRTWADKVHGAWVSPSSSAFQNACWAIEFDENCLSFEESIARLRNGLRDLADEFRQDSILWAEVAHTEFLGPVEAPDAG